MEPEGLRTVSRLGDGSPLLEGLGLVTVRIPLSVLAGITAHFLCNWKKLTPDYWVLQTVMGYRIEMLTTPQQTHRPVTVVPKDQEPLLQEEIAKLCQKGAVIPVDRVGSQSTGFCSTIFLVPKKDTNETGSESETPQSFSAKSALQNGAIACGLRSPAEGGLVVQNRPEGHTFCDPSLQGTSISLSCVSFGGPRLISSHASCLGLCPHLEYLPRSYNRCRFSPAEGSEVCDILERPAYNGMQQGAGSPTVCCSHTATQIPRFSCELFQVTDTPDTTIDVPRPQYGFN